MGIEPVGTLPEQVARLNAAIGIVPAPYGVEGYVQGRYVDERYPTETAVAALMRADAFIARELSSEVHKLILACLTDDRFKGAFASEFAELYEDLADQYANGV